MTKIKYLLPSHFKQQLFGFTLYTILFFAFSHRVYFNITLYNQFDEGIVSEIRSSSMDSEASGGTAYYLTTKNNKKVDVSYWDNGKDPLGLMIGDTIYFRYVSSNTVEVLKRNGVEIGSYFQIFDYFSLIMTIVLGLGYYYIPKIYKKAENEQNKKITDYLNSKHR